MKDQNAKTPFNTWQEKLDGKPIVVEQIAAKMLADGVVMQAWMSHFVLAPPLIVEKEDIDKAVAALDSALVLADSLLTQQATAQQSSPNCLDLSVGWGGDESFSVKWGIMERGAL